MITNKAGNVYVPTENNGHVNFKVYKTVTTMAEYLETPTPENEPDHIAMHIGNAFKDKVAITVCNEGEILQDKMDEVLEAVIVAEVKKNPKLLLRTKWDTIDLKVVIPTV